MYEIVFSPKQNKELLPFRTDVAIRFHPLRTPRAGAARNKTNHETSEKIDIK